MLILTSDGVLGSNRGRRQGTPSDLQGHRAQSDTWTRLSECEEKRALDVRFQSQGFSIPPDLLQVAKATFDAVFLSLK